MNGAVDNEVALLLDERLRRIEEHFKSDALMFYGPLKSGIDDMFKQHIEDMSQHTQIDRNIKRLLIILTTNGGSAETVERIVNTTRHHYDEVNFLVPDFAYSAGTIFCMSGNNIFMDYYSVLGPIDPQVETKDKKLVAAQGFLDKIKELIEKSKTKEGLSNAEFLILKDFNLAEMREYEQAKSLTEDLLKKWLVKYKFKNWTVHSDGKRLVTNDEKIDRAQEIAVALSNTGIWHTHSRPISIKDLIDIGLKIEDYSSDVDVQHMINQYYYVVKDYITKYGHDFLFHTRRHET